MMQFLFLNGAYLSADRAMISPFDRGFLFAQSAYEVTAVYNHQLIDFKAHTTRLSRTLEALDIPNPYSLQAWETIHRELIQRNDLREGLIYLQVSAGAYDERDFAGPDTFTPTVFLFASSKPLITEPSKHGIKATTVADSRWSRRDLKTTQLVSQALAYREARAAGCDTAIMIEDDHVTEAASASVFIVDADGTLRTRDLSTALLHSITRERSLSLLAANGLNVVEGSFRKSVLEQAVEVFTTSAGALIAPVVEIDGVPVGDGLPGPVTRQVQRLYYQHIGVEVDALDWLTV
ncbi:MAG: aminotransferase class IV [Pseudomonadota bacterium]